LVRRHTAKFYAVAFRILRNKEEAEDVVQDCFLKFWYDPSIWVYEKKTKFTTWFCKIVINKCYDCLKKFKEAGLDDNFDIADNAKNAEHFIDEKERNNILNAAYLTLDIKQRTALALSFFENNKNQESAKIMKLSLKAFQSLLMRSKEALKNQFEKLGGIYE